MDKERPIQDGSGGGGLGDGNNNNYSLVSAVSLCSAFLSLPSCLAEWTITKRFMLLLEVD